MVRCLNYQTRGPGRTCRPSIRTAKCTTVAAYDIPVFKQRQGNPLKSNPKFEEWKKNIWREADKAESEPGQENAEERHLCESKGSAGGDRPACSPTQSKVKVTGR